ncbi:MAG: alpha/beta fold hydrolase [Rhizobiales bacterium]|nr:alpha/beta fold hydrolase [Hyphomicrobiales bacterium]
MTALEFDLRLVGRTTRVRIAGEGTPVILIHGGGLGSSGRVWLPVVPHLAASHRIIVPDLIGFGDSSTPDVEDGLPLFIRQISELLDVLCLDRAVLVGHSMGCQIATVLALRSPMRVQGLGLFACGGRFVGVSYESAGHALLEEVIANPTEAAVRSLVECVNGVLDDVDAEVAERMRWARRSGHLAAQRNLAAARRQPGRGEVDYAGVDRLRMPIVLGWGDLERFNPVEIGPQIAGRLPRGSRYQVFRGAGHNIPHDRPAEAAQVIADLVRAAVDMPVEPDPGVIATTAAI